MMQWIATCGTIAASRVARGNVVLGAMDDIDFLHPVKVGEVAVLRAQVEYVGRCSLEVGVQVFAESPRTGERALTLSSHLVFVKVDGAVRPRTGAAGHRSARRRRGGLARGGPGAAQPSAPALRPAGRAGGRDGRRRHRGLALALRVVSLGPARGHVVRPGHVRREAPDGHRRGGRHPLDALQPRPRHDGVSRRARFLRADLDQRGGDVQGRPQPRRHARRSRSGSRCWRKRR